MKKYIGLLTFFTLLFVSGCSTEGIEKDGIWDHFFVQPLSNLIVTVAHLFQDNYGLSIIVVTLLVRLVLFPLFLSQQKSTKQLQVISPKLKELQKKYDKKRDQASQQEYQKEMMSLYREHQVNPFGAFLPIFIQLPILIAFYTAIRHTDALSTHQFLWFQLGSPDTLFILPILAALTTFITSWMSSSSATDAQTQSAMRITLFIMPIMIFMASKGVPAALSLYWVVGGLVSIAQSYYFRVKLK